MKNKHILFVILALGIIALLGFVFFVKKEETIVPVAVKKATEAPTVSNGPKEVEKATVLSEVKTAPATISTGITTGIVSIR